MTRTEFLQWKRQLLLAESATQRAEVAAQLQSLSHVLTSAQIGLRIADRVRRHPGWVAAAVLGLAVVTPRRLSSFLRMGMLGLKGWRLVAPMLRARLYRD
jgi:hypothetical protein